jgi:hypothetical protein
VWGPAGILYVASAGVPPDLDAGRPGLQAGVVKLQGEVRSIITTFLTNVSWAPIFDVIGVTDVALLDQQLYMLVASGTAATNGVYRIDAERIITSPGNVVEGIVVQIAESAGWLSQYPPAETPPEGFPNPGVPFAMVAGDDRLWVVDALNGLVLSITPDGTIGLAADLSPGHPLPTGIALAPDGGLYIGTLTRPPFPPGGAKVLHISDDGTVSDAWTGLTAVTGVVVGPTGVLYASEMLTGDSAEHEGSTAGSGRVVRQTGPDSSEVIATGLRLPTALDIGRDGALYVALSYPVGVSEDSALDGAIIRLALS